MQTLKHPNTKTRPLQTDRTLKFADWPEAIFEDYPRHIF